MPIADLASCELRCLDVSERRQDLVLGDRAQVDEILAAPPLVVGDVIVDGCFHGVWARARLTEPLLTPQFLFPPGASCLLSLLEGQDRDRIGLLEVICNAQPHLGVATLTDEAPNGPGASTTGSAAIA